MEMQEIPVAQEIPKSPSSPTDQEGADPEQMVREECVVDVEISRWECCLAHRAGRLDLLLSARRHLLCPRSRRRASARCVDLCRFRWNDGPRHNVRSPPTAFVAAALGRRRLHRANGAVLLSSASLFLAEHIPAVCQAAGHMLCTIRRRTRERARPFP